MPLSQFKWEKASVNVAWFAIFYFLKAYPSAWKVYEDQSFQKSVSDENKVCLDGLGRPALFMFLRMCI